ncbi:MAG: hypothetical protein ACI4VH_07045 [Clostridia bacterium]
MTSVGTSRLRITGKYMEEKLKRGYGTSYFLKSQNISEDEFFQYLKKNFSSKAYTSMCKRLKNNEKSSKKFGFKSSAHTTADIADDETSPATMTDFTYTENNEETETVEVEDSISPIDMLKEQERELSSVICSEEAEHVQLISKRASLKSQFQKQKAQLRELTHKIEAIRNDFEKTFSEWEKLGSDMHSLTESISNRKASLEVIRNEIILLQKISIFAYENGEIEFENVGDFDTTTDSSSEAALFNKLIQNNVVESLTIKNIRQLAKLILIVEKLNAEHLSFELTFEDSTVQEVFNSIN